jgi:hypothetical protein
VVAAEAPTCRVSLAHGVVSRPKEMWISAPLNPRQNRWQISMGETSKQHPKPTRGSKAHRPKTQGKGREPARIGASKGALSSACSGGT